MLAPLLRRRLLLLFLFLLPAACADDDLADASGGAVALDGTIWVFAAASLTDAFTALAGEFETAHPSASVELSFAGSSTLREQILDGAPADVFASADRATMDEVVDAGGVEATPAVFVRNTLEIAVPAGNPAGVTGLADLGRDELFIGLCAVEIPCGRFAREALAAAGVEPAPDTYEPDVRSLLSKLAEGELDAGIVYRTDVLAEGGVEGIEVPEAQNVVAEYPIAALAEAGEPELAAAFVAYVLGPPGQDLLGAYGFDVDGP